MADYCKILLSVDFSIHTDMLCDKALAIAQRNNAQLGLLHVVEPMFIEPGVDFLSVGDLALEHTLEERAEQHINELAKRYRISEEWVWIRHGSTKHEIICLSKEHNFDLIVVGSHGRHGVARLLGSTANGVLHSASCDVLAVRIPDPQ